VRHVPKFNSRKISYRVGPHKFYRFWFYDDVIERMTPGDALELLKLKKIPEGLKDEIEDYSTEEFRNADQTGK
jgi:hypothetical protein